MDEKKERKRNLITVRITKDEMNTLDYLSDCLGQSKSDTMLRASKFLLNTMGGNLGSNVDDVNGSGTDEIGARKNCQVHLRITDSDMAVFNDHSEKSGLTVSQIVRTGLKSYERFKRNHY